MHHYGATRKSKRGQVPLQATKIRLAINGMIIAFHFTTVRVRLITLHFYNKPGGHDVSRKGIRAD
jgi:hypothetical protein